MRSKIKYVVPKIYQKKTIKIVLFLLLTMVLEALGLGLLLPIVSIILDPEIMNNYPLVTEFLSEYGLVAHQQIILIIMIGFGIIYLFKTVLLVYVSWVLADYSQGLSDVLSAKLYAGYINQPYIDSINTNSANLQRNVTNEVNQFTGFITNLLFFISELAICISIILTLIYVDSSGAFTVVGLLIVLSIIYYVCTKGFILKLGQHRLKFDQKRIFTLIQSLGSFKEIKLFNKESFFINLFKKRNSSYYNLIKKNQVLQQLPRHYFELSAVLGLTFYIVLSISNGADLNNLVAVLSVFLLAAFRLVPSANRMLSNIQAVKYGSVSVEFLYNELNKINANKKIENNISTLFNFNKPILIENVSYSYPNTDTIAIDNINLKIPANSFIGIIGESGSGKSTFIDNLIGFIHPSSGKITINNVDIHKSTSLWMSNIGYVPQTIHLSDSSLRNNIAFGIDDDDIDNDKITEAIENAELSNFVKSLSDGIYTNIEGTSALDVETETSIINSILKFKNNKTIIMIAHRHSTLSECDMLLEFNEAKMNLKSIK